MISTSLKNNIANKWFGGTSFTAASTLYLRLSTTSINANGTGVTEPTDSGYKALALPNNTTTFSAPVNGVIRTQKDFQFDVMETTASWTVTHYFISSSPTSTDPNTFYNFGKLKYKRTAVAGTIFVLEQGDFEIELHSKESGKSGITYQFANRILSDIYGKRTVTVPTQYYYGLSSTPIVMNKTTGDITGITELYSVDNTFKRIPITNNKTYFTNATDGTIKNAQDITFDRFVKEVSQPINTTHYFVTDVNNPTALTKENVYYFGELTNVIPVEVQTTPLLKTGNASITISNCDTESV